MKIHYKVQIQILIEYMSKKKQDENFIVYLNIGIPKDQNYMLPPLVT